jgi:hypothetical protein
MQKNDSIDYLMNDYRIMIEDETRRQKENGFASTTYLVSGVGSELEDLETKLSQQQRTLTNRKRGLPVISKQDPIDNEYINNAITLIYINYYRPIYEDINRCIDLYDYKNDTLLNMLLDEENEEELTMARKSNLLFKAKIISKMIKNNEQLISKEEYDALIKASARYEAINSKLTKMQAAKDKIKKLKK